MTTEIKLIFAAIVLVLIGLAVWGVKHAVDLFAETQAQNATLKRDNAELLANLGEQQRTAGILAQVATRGKENQNEVLGFVGEIRNQLRALSQSDPVLRDRADRAVPDAIQQRLRKYPVDPDGYPIMQGSGPVGSPDKGAGSGKPDGGK